MGSVSETIMCDAAPHNRNSNRMDTMDTCERCEPHRFIVSGHSPGLDNDGMWSSEDGYRLGSQHIPIMLSSHDSLRHMFPVTS